jgi:hypothetical protein
MGQPTVHTAALGLNLDSVPSQRKQGQLSFAQNAVVSGVDETSIAYQNELATRAVGTLPPDTTVVGTHYIPERNLIIYFLRGTSSQIGKFDTISGIYTTLIAWSCLSFENPIHKVQHKTTSLGLEIYWADPVMRYLDIDNIPSENCNALRVQPHYQIPQINIAEVGSDGELLAGTYQFVAQYATAAGDPFTQFHSATNPLAVTDPLKVTPDFNFPTGASIQVSLANVDITGVFEYINVAVVKTINNITSIDLIDTIKIDKANFTLTYTGQSKTGIKLTPNELFEQFPLYEKAHNVTSAQDILVWSDLETATRLNYQSIWAQVTVGWESHKLPYEKGENYSKSIYTASHRGYFRDEVYSLEGAFILGDGRISDGFHIPGRLAVASDLEQVDNLDARSTQGGDCDESNPGMARWQVYNTASIDAVIPDTGDDCYVGPYAYGKMAYWQSELTYPDTDQWGTLRGQPIRHHKMPDSLVSHIHDAEGNIYPLAIKIDASQVKALVEASDLTQEEKDNIVGFTIFRGNRAAAKSVVARGLIYNVGKYERDKQNYFYPNYPYNDLRSDPFLSNVQTGDDSGHNLQHALKGFDSADSQKRFTFHSPDTHFYQPFLGNRLKLETVENGVSSSHFTEVKNHARYKLLSTGAYGAGAAIGLAVGAVSRIVGVSSTILDGTAVFTAFQSIMVIIEKTIPRVNYAYQFTSVGRYTDAVPVPNEGSKIRFADIASYLTPGMLSTGDTHVVNNFQRESSVYLRTTEPLPFPHTVGGVVDESRWTLTQNDNKNEILSKPISAYYATIKRSNPTQYGAIYSGESVSTGAFHTFGNDNFTCWGGDCFIGKFGLKRKLPFFTDHRANYPDEADIDFRDATNVGRPIYWFSTDASNKGEAGGIFGVVKQVFGVKLNNFDDKRNKFFYQYGKFYLFAYGIPYYYCESEVNVEMRQATNGAEGDFYPHVGEDIPDEWLQYKTVPIEQDNTFVYNKSFSKQNKESVITHLPPDFDTLKDATRKLPNSAIYSEPQIDSTTYRRNNWLIYRPVSRFDFPLNHGKLTSVDGIGDAEILARFENKSLIYNRLVKIDTSTPLTAYIGNDKFLKGSPPIELPFGSQHKLLIQLDQGVVTVDAKRGKVHLVMGSQVEELSSEKYNCSKFFATYLPFSTYTDNHFGGLGLTGAYDKDGNRFMITKREVIHGCVKSFTISFSLTIMRWVSFHTYHPNYYVSADDNLYSSNTQEIYKHDDVTSYNKVYDLTAPYILEYVIPSTKGEDEILQSIEDYTKVFEQRDEQTQVQRDDIYFNKALISTDQMCSGILNLVAKPQGNLQAYMTYPVYNTDSKDILFTKVNNTYNYNGFWDVVKSKTEPIFQKNCTSIHKELNTDNMDYSKKSFSKYPLRARDFKVRHILDNRTDVRLVTQFLIAEQQTST